MYIAVNSNVHILYTSIALLSNFMQHVTAMHSNAHGCLKEAGMVVMIAWLYTHNIKHFSLNSNGHYIMHPERLP